MTRLEFTLKLEEMFRRRTLHVLPMFVAWLIVPGASWLKQRFGNSAEIGAFVLAAASMLWVIWSERRLPRKFGLLCPNCSRSLVGEAGRHVLLTGNCKHCGKAVFDERSDVSSSKSKLTKQQFTS